MSAIAFKLYKPQNTCCIVVGLGLIGRSITQYLSLYGEQVKDGVKFFSWNNSNEITSAINALMKSSECKKLELIWSAGRAGFSATDDEMQQEYNIFSACINKLAINHGTNLSLNFLSSAGGLYEGTDSISTIDDVIPGRPYGRWKLKQEELLLSQQVPVRIYRISSAYGFAQETTRFGLIDNLINSAITKNNTLIYADPSTLRDYVFTADIARFVIEGIISSRPTCTQILASGRPVSVDMLINAITQLLRKRVNVTYSTGKTNSRDIIFPTRLLPKNMTITSLEESIRRITMNRYFS